MRTSIIKWVKNHDDSSLFVYTYIAAAIILSIAISLFWLVLVVMVHLFFELLKQYFIRDTYTGAIKKALWELKLDFGLILFSFVLAIYLDVILGAAGIAAATRAGAQSVSRISIRFIGFQRVIRGIVLSIDEAILVFKPLFSKRKTTRKNGKNPDHNSFSAVGDYLSLSFLLISFILIVFAPFIVDVDYSGIYETMLIEFHPFP